MHFDTISLFIILLGQNDHFESVNLCLLPNLGKFQPLFLWVFSSDLFYLLFMGPWLHVIKTEVVQ